MAQFPNGKWLTFRAELPVNEYVGEVASFLTGEGFSVVHDSVVESTVRRLSSKTRAHAELFLPLSGASIRRPASITISRLGDIGRIIGAHAEPASGKWVVKSDRSVGGIGVFVLQDAAIRGKEVTLPMLTAKGYNRAIAEPPFILEEYITHELSPTADGYVSSQGEVYLAGVAVQRLFDNRYYAGFFCAESFRGTEWFPQVCDGVREVGVELSRRGYFGFFNLDFVVDSHDGMAYIVEINPRRSALQDGFSIGLAVRSSGFSVTSLSVADYVECRTLKNLCEVHDIAKARSRDDVLLLATTDAAFHSSFRWISLLTLGEGDTEEVLARIAAQVADLPDDRAALEEDIGPLPIRVH